jgi:hypothetical protein
MTEFPINTEKPIFETPKSLESIVGNMGKQVISIIEYRYHYHDIENRQKRIKNTGFTIHEHDHTYIWKFNKNIFTSQEVTEHTLHSNLTRPKILIKTKEDKNGNHHISLSHSEDKQSITSNEPIFKEVAVLTRVNGLWAIAGKKFSNEAIEDINKTAVLVNKIYSEIHKSGMPTKNPHLHTIPEQVENPR